ncbi:unnamed protein product [Clonostachys rhizophaga]|uniref:Zn(2)-C6 fungal-type domain-containing protein n=1 Tax=Clonostachys rhizophaga TaxID=160324 RepID=A0A9N9YFD5_9HYPO|nr:unnamed protein product [Clonostachys rhizophaga]
MTDTKDAKDGHGRTACSECQRRKQKCNREWPCNHCQKRKVADKCHFKELNPNAVDRSAGETSKKRGREPDSSHADELDDILNEDDDDNDDLGLEALGYSSSNIFTDMRNAAGPKIKMRPPEKQDFALPSACPQLQHALDALPPRPYLDQLVDNFLTHVNFHYFIIYPPSFRDEYRDWWTARAENQPLGLQWTCLLLMVCACSAQYCSVELEGRLQRDFLQSCQTLGEKYHGAGRQLYSVIPVGHSHFYSVQQLLHSCYWFKSEAQFPESWHILNSAVRAAQDLGMHQETENDGLSMLEKEMRRRVWCVLDTWDWQISALLARPIIIDRADCNVAFPSLNLESYSPSPSLHMTMQSQLIKQLADRFGLPKNVQSEDEVREYQTMLEQWISTFPPTYDVNRPDKSQDQLHPWIVLHRHYLHTMAHSMLLDPIRAYLAKVVNKNTSEKSLQIRRDGVRYALRLMDALYGFFDYVWPRDAKFHFVLFCIFDTATVHGSVILHDEDKTVERRDEILVAIERAIDMVDRLKEKILPAKTYLFVLKKMQRKVLKKLGIFNRIGNKKQRLEQSSLSSLPGPAPGTTSTYSSQAAPASASGPSTSSRSHFDSHGASTTTVESGSSLTGPPMPAGPELAIPEPTAYPASGPFDMPLFSDNNWPPETGMYFDPLAMQGQFLPDGQPTLDALSLHPSADPSMGPDMGFPTIATEELGELANLWRWESLDLGFIEQTPAQSDPPPPGPPTEGTE